MMTQIRLANMSFCFYSNILTSIDKLTYVHNYAIKKELEKSQIKGTT